MIDWRSHASNLVGSQNCRKWCPPSLFRKRVFLLAPSFPLAKDTCVFAENADKAALAFTQLCLVHDKKRDEIRGPSPRYIPVVSLGRMTIPM